MRRVFPGMVDDWQVEDNTFGSPAAEQLLHKIQPDFWFSAHHHVKFAAVVRCVYVRTAAGV